MAVSSALAALGQGLRVSKCRRWMSNYYVVCPESNDCFQTNYLSTVLPKSSKVRLLEMYSRVWS